MLPRTLVRIKVLSTFYSTLTNISKVSVEEDYQKALKIFIESTKKTDELFLFLINIFDNYIKTLSKENDYFIKKNTISKEEYDKFNSLKKSDILSKIYLSKTYKDSQKLRLLFSNNEDTFFSILDIFKKEIYNIEKTDDFKTNKENIIKFIEEKVFLNNDFYDAIKDVDIFWSDDVVYVYNIFVKWLDVINKNYVPDEFKCFNEKNHIKFGKSLLKYSMGFFNNSGEKISKHLKNWEYDRIPKVEKIILCMAYTEMVLLKETHPSVVISEYIELTKFYSADKNTSYINAVLQNILNEYR